MLILPNAAALADIAAQFQIDGKFLRAIPYGSGHINDTYASSFEHKGVQARYIHQRINSQVFKDPVKLMENIVRVTRHQALHGKGLELLYAKSGLPYHLDGEGRYWRSYIFIENARTYDVIQNPGQAEAAARAFGSFQKMLAELPQPPLHETIPDFHHTPKRLESFVASVAADALGRAEGCKDEIKLAMEMAPWAGTLSKQQARGLLPLRVVHNDTKLNNVMLDDASGAGVCVIDLDTAMPGLSVCDFGDMVRSATSPVKEDEADLSLVKMQWPMFEALARGFVAGTGGLLNKAELQHLAVAGLLMTYECGLRFLGDHLNGDSYFRVQRPGQNLDRARNQLRLAQEIEKNLSQMEKFISKL